MSTKFRMRRTWRTQFRLTPAQKKAIGGEIRKLRKLRKLLMQGESAAMVAQFWLVTATGEIEVRARTMDEPDTVALNRIIMAAKMREKGAKP